MRLFNRFDVRWPIVKAKAAALPPRGTSDGSFDPILPPFQTNPPTGPISSRTGGDLSEQFIHSDPRELWYLALPSKLTPKQVVMILRSALGGDLWQQWQLCSLMLDTWPMLRKCSHEISQAVAGTKFIVKPFAAPGEEPSKAAVEQADLVQRALYGMQPAPMAEEQGAYGMLYDLACDGMLNGMTMQELLWEERGGEMLPRCAVWVHPRHFGYYNDGRIAIFDETYERLNFALAKGPAARNGQDEFMANKFLLGKFKSRSGSALGNGLMRPLAWYWSAMVFNRDWMLNFAKKYGSPFLEASYNASMPADELNRLDDFLAQGVANGYLRHRSEATVTVHPAQTLGANNPQATIKDEADEAVMLMFLGQTATTKSVAGKLGAEDTHEAVKRENIQGVARWVGEVLTNQLARAVCRLNYYDGTECPTVEPDATEDLDPMVQAQITKIFIDAGVPMHAEEVYKANGMSVPEEGDQVVVAGELGIMAATDRELGGEPPEPEPPPFGAAPGLPGNGAVPGQKPKPESDEGEPDVRKAVAKASAKDLAELKELLVKAIGASHQNGEAEAVRVKIKAIAKKRVARRTRA